MEIPIHILFSFQMNLLTLSNRYELFDCFLGFNEPVAVMLPNNTITVEAGPITPTHKMIRHLLQKFYWTYLKVSSS